MKSSLLTFSEFWIHTACDSLMLLPLHGEILHCCPCLLPSLQQSSGSAAHASPSPARSPAMHGANSWHPSPSSATARDESLVPSLRRLLSSVSGSPQRSPAGVNLSPSWSRESPTAAPREGLSGKWSADGGRLSGQRNRSISPPGTLSPHVKSSTLVSEGWCKELLVTEDVRNLVVRLHFYSFIFTGIPAYALAAFSKSVSPIVASDISLAALLSRNRPAGMMNDRPMGTGLMLLHIRLVRMFSVTYQTPDDAPA